MIFMIMYGTGCLLTGIFVGGFLSTTYWCCGMCSEQVGNYENEYNESVL
jgi:hypothetical protein